MTRVFFVIMCALALCSCAAPEPLLKPGAAESLAVAPLNNLAGVPLKFPAIYFGDSLGTGEELEVEKLDLLQLGRAALLARLRERGYNAELSERAAGARHAVHAAITRFDLDALKETGRITLGLVVVLVDAGGVELGQAQAERVFQLMSSAPNEGGALGESRFIEAKLQAFVEALATEALNRLGV